LSFLPLHASGCYDQPGTKLPDYVISSYTPTLSALITAGSFVSPKHSRVLAIGQEATPGQSRLPGTKAELSAIAKHAQPPLQYTQIAGHDATTTGVLAAMEEHEWVHLACHAHQNRNEPIESGFFLHDGTLSLASIAQKSFKHKGLAFLSACQTARGDENLADEAVHLASGMLMAGYPSIIATMWSVKDEDAPVVADQVYGQLLKDGKMDYKDAAKALHEAVGALRAKVGENEFGRWVPYIHMGV
jgi:CHAT domain-containing protein